jgi:hypothetical protein
MQKMAQMLKNSLQGMDLDKMEAMQKAQEQAMQALEGLQEIIDGQQALLDLTHKMQPGARDRDAAARQDALRQKLAGLLDEIAKITPDAPDNLKEADGAMAGAVAALKSGKTEDAGAAQAKALAALQKSMDGGLARMAAAMRQSILSFGFAQPGGGSGTYDPLGRGTGGQNDPDGVSLPQESERRRVQEIIRDLRDRSNDYTRPKPERDYIDRLLDQSE